MESSSIALLERAGQGDFAGQWRRAVAASRAQAAVAPIAGGRFIGRVSALPASTMIVEVPWASTRPSPARTCALAEMICRPWDTTLASARTRPVSCVIGLQKLPLVSIVV